MYPIWFLHVKAELPNTWIQHPQQVGVALNGLPVSRGRTCPASNKRPLGAPWTSPIPLQKASRLSGGYRLIILLRTQHRAFFVYGYAKNKQEDLEPKDLRGFKSLAEGLLGCTDAQLVGLLKDGEISEVKCSEDAK